ncbi:MAG: methylmalonyl-CoA mutase family protein [Candidatus Neomarinimicrobiota bacterium]|nr:methylmalonyl-CoA mutase family protein [Candidatus Neomarinimicrobiota bacterium]
MNRKKNTRKYNFDTISGNKLKEYYSSQDNDINPGEFPYTRGIHSNMYRGKLWTMRQFSGFSTPEETNQRYKYLLKKGQTGLSVAYDMPTLMGYDPDHELSVGEVGVCGVNVSSLEDMETLFKGIDLEKISISQTINGPAIILFAFYVALAKKNKIDISKLRGTLQNDALKEYMAQKEWIFPPSPSVKLVVDVIEFCSKNMPLYNPVSISGYHIREAGSTAAQELAFTLNNGFTYIDECLERGLKIDDFAHRLSFFFNSHIDFFEEIGKYRAARRIWANKLKNQYKARNENSLKLKFHTQTAGCSLTAQQPENNIVRTAYEAMAAVLGGTNSLHTNSLDETLALPSEKAAKIALRTQQVLAYETGVASVADPLGGSWYIEDITNRIEKEANKYFEIVKRLGGTINAIEEGYFQKEIADSASIYQESIDTKDRIIVGINDFIEKDEKLDIEILKISKKAQKIQEKKIEKLKKNRNTKNLNIKMKKLRNACENNLNLVPYLVSVAEEGATIGEIVEVMKTVYGEWEESFGI